jgi:hypothetical protein
MEKLMNQVLAAHNNGGFAWPIHTPRADATVLQLIALQPTDPKTTEKARRYFFCETKPVIEWLLGHSVDPDTFSGAKSLQAARPELDIRIYGYLPSCVSGHSKQAVLEGEPTHPSSKWGRYQVSRLPAVYYSVLYILF